MLPVLVAEPFNIIAVLQCLPDGIETTEQLVTGAGVDSEAVVWARRGADLAIEQVDVDAGLAAGGKGLIDQLAVDVLWKCKGKKAVAYTVGFEDQREAGCDDNAKAAVAQCPYSVSRELPQPKFGPAIRIVACRYRS
ncbi:Uncharacterised protein [Mycobacteroides abscessus]|nr:Uncharacterised protein [Mycobacteroides abscessus]